jgi:hypothetical protein
MINRAAKEGVDLGEHVSGRIYQPSIEPSQQARLDQILRSEHFPELTSWTERRVQGLEEDPVKGATHFLASEPVMEKLRAQNPGKYKSWVNWSGYNRGGGQYTNPDGTPVIRDADHAFLAPEGAFSAPYKGPSPPVMASAAPSPIHQTGVGRLSFPSSHTLAAAPSVSAPSPIPSSAAAPATPSPSPAMPSGAFSNPMAALGQGLGAFSGMSQDQETGQKATAEALNSVLQANAAALQDDPYQMAALRSVLGRYRG